MPLSNNPIRSNPMESDNCDNPSSSSSSVLPPLLSFSEDCLIQILLWLPVISLLRFKSVCKSWRAIIQNPFFIHTHATTTTTTTTTTTNKKVVFLRYSYWLLVGDIFSVSGPEFKVYEDLGIPGPEFEVLEDLDPDLDDLLRYYRNKNARYYKNITMTGCCNGIICLHDKDNPKCFIDATISLWNPAIKQYRFLPVPFAIEDPEDDYVDYFVEWGPTVKRKFVDHFVGFGFDLKTKDYKVLLITYDIYVGRHYCFARGVQVYSLSTNSWRCVDASSSSDALPYLIIHRWEDRDQGHYLNGSYLFMGGYLLLYEDEEEGDQEAPTNYNNTNNSRQEEEEEECFFKPVILSFDFTKEIFRTIQLPFDLKILKTDEYKKSAFVILFGEKIAVTNACCQDMSCSTACLDIWVLNENGGSDESWSKFYTFVSEAMPKFITDDGEFILLDARTRVPKLKLLNVVTEEIKDLKYEYDDCEGPSNGKAILIARVGVYKPSLIPIAAGNGATDNYCLQV